MKKRSILLFIVFIFFAGFVGAIASNQRPLTTVNTASTIPPIPSESKSATPTVVIINTPTLVPKNPTSKPISPSGTAIPTLDELFAKYGKIYNVDSNVLKSIASCESGFDTNQVTGDYAGLFQFASFAWVEARGRMGLSSDQSLRFNAEESIKTAAFEINYKGTSGWSDCD